MGEGTLEIAAGRRPLGAAGRPVFLFAVALAAVALSLCLRAPAADAAPTRCAGTFRVLHNDHIGTLSVPAGRYVITVRNGAFLSCPRASKLFTRFLEDFDGRLPRPWVLTGPGAQFRRGQGSRIGFSITRNASGGNTPGGGGRHPSNGYFCPGTFRVLNRDHIGRLRLASGPYYVILLQSTGLSCRQASALFRRFLNSTSGVLPGRWNVEPQTARFVRGRGGVAFRVKPAR